MILVDIYVPSVNNTYDFQLDENVKIVHLIEEIVELISQKEHCRLSGNMSDLVLCDCAGERILSPAATLAESGIETGSSLILV